MGRRGMTLQLKYIDRFKDRHGKIRLYYRPPGSKRIALPDENDRGFLAAYQAAVPLPSRSKRKPAFAATKARSTDWLSTTTGPQTFSA